MLVEKLVRCYSPSGKEKKAVQLLVNELKERGFQAYQDKAGNGIGLIGHGSRSIYLVSHIDTVAGEIPVSVKDRKLYGRGSVDAKASLAGFVEAASKFSDSTNLTLTVIACVEEEMDSTGANYILASFDPPDYVVIGEPSGWDALTLGYKGSLFVNFILEKPKHHHGFPELTVAEEAVAFYQSLCSAYSNSGVGFEEISFRLIDLNTSSYGSHESVQMGISIRTPPGFGLEDMEANMKRFQGEASVTWNGYIPAVVANKHSELVRAFLNGIRSHGGRPRFKYKTGTSDMNLLSKWDCPILAYGPGDSSLDHSPDEHLDLDEYQRSITVLFHALKKLEV